MIITVYCNETRFYVCVCEVYFLIPLHEQKKYHECDVYNASGHVRICIICISMIIMHIIFICLFVHHFDIMAVYTIQFVKPIRRKRTYTHTTALATNYYLSIQILEYDSNRKISYANKPWEYINRF